MGFYKVTKIMKAKITHLIFFLLCAAVLQAFAQNVPKNSPFTPGEVLTYEGKLSKSILRGIIGIGADLTFEVATAPNGKDYLFKAKAHSKGALIKLAKKEFSQEYESAVDKEKFHVLKTTKLDEQNERVREGEAFFDYQERRVTYVETDPKDRMRPPRRIASAIEEGTLDLLSGIYYLRQLPLAVGKTFEISVSDSGFVYKVPVRVTAREQQSSILGKVWCFRVEPEVFGAKRLIEDEGRMIIWITDDKSRIPVRSQIHSGIGKVDIKLKKVGK
jgi:hypothetical protein